jgi:cysteinyl-tRNA synthetase
MLKLFDSLARKKRLFRPLKPGTVTMYNCGPTVYDYVHIGNLRAFLFADLLRRYLGHRGLKVTQVMNITDVGHMLADADEGEDKIEAAAAKIGKDPLEIAKFYAEAFFHDIDRLGVRRADVYPRASEHVPEMIALIERLLSAGCAYKVPLPDGGTNVYFDVAAFADYGRLSGNRLEGISPGARLEVREEKRHPADFALWIYNPRHLMQWDAPWGRGYPGWHLECSAMAMKYLGETIDIHTGGEDNKFPHHECEIAQSECATGQPFARYWLHLTHLLVDGEKMSKSKGSFFTLDDLLAKGHEPRSVRYLLLSTHYRQPLNFTFAGLDGAKSALTRLDNFADAVRGYSSTVRGRADAAGKRALRQMVSSLDDDLNVAEALAAAFEYVRTGNESLSAGTLTMTEKRGAEEFLKKLGDIFGFTFGRAASEAEVPASVLVLVEKRQTARSERRFSESDELRGQVLRLGYVLEDSPDGAVKIKRA